MFYMMLGSAFIVVKYFFADAHGLCVMLFRSRLPANSKANGKMYLRTLVTALCKVQCKTCISSTWRITVWWTTKIRLE
jgi:hypothetical protein